ncbi:MAG TPA: polymer-forming cytoskeletal protein, partial [Candidatus Babeliales bacterium]|nr:polymer-forming cytoskeletal protein [Candidatus Babeliales bacterium]
KVVGNVYANGNIVANNGVTITGSAIAAPSASVTSDQSNSGTIPITTCTATTCLSFGSTTAAQDFAQSFKVSTASSPLHDVQFYIKKVGAPSDITVRIVDDSSGSPGTTNELTTNGTLLASQVSGSSFGWVDVVFPSTPTLDPAKTYWLVLDDGSNSATNYYLLGATNNTYANGLGKLGKYTSTWTSTQPAGLDSDFNLYLGVTTSIGGGTYVGAVNIGQSGVGDAWANTVSGASVAGSLYCQTGSNNNKACNTTRPDPAPTTMPLSDANIQDFKDEATTTGSGWTYTGNLTIGYQGTTTTSLQHVTGNLTINGGGVAVMSDLQVDGSVTITGGGKLTVGPLRVNGDLDVESTMSMTGTVYVLGNVTIGSGATLKLDAGYGANSGVLISDGYATVSGGSSFSGSGQSTSFPLLITTSTCPSGTGCGSNNAINFNGGAGAVVLVAQNGTINMSGGTGAEALTAKEIDVSGGATITYNSGLANLNFSSGPSGGWNITSWKEVQ